MWRPSTMAFIGLAFALLPMKGVLAQQPSEENLAKAAQNPVAAMISVPFQNNTNFDVGPFKRAQDILNIQPVVPITLNSDWNLISRTIIPLIDQPRLLSDSKRFSCRPLIPALSFGASGLCSLLQPPQTRS
jgi:hypothetical protein